LVKSDQLHGMLIAEMAEITAVNYNVITKACFVYGSSSSYCTKHSLVVMCYVYPAAEIAVKIVDGFHQLSVPMISRRHSCRFTLQPYANTLGDFCKSILEEDKAIKQVHAENEGNLH